ncbi:MAG: hypothetical protein Q8J84_03825 [Flavobacteriaceae bacterium]|nr:hypothetical protein [Flavobacteriaceae bacterium]
MRKLHFLRIPFLALVTIILFVSCNKDSAFNIGEKEQQERVFTDFQIESIGKIHNQSLELSFKNFNWNTTNKLKEINYQFNNLELAKDNSLNFEGKPKSIEQNLSTIKQLINNDQDYAFFEKSMNYLLNTTRKTTVLNIQNFLTDLEKEAKTKMSSIRSYETFLIFSSVSKKSAYFLLPKENGGLGKFNKFKELEQKHSTFRKYLFHI